MTDLRREGHSIYHGEREIAHTRAIECGMGFEGDIALPDTGEIAEWLVRRANAHQGLVDALTDIEEAARNIKRGYALAAVERIQERASAALKLAKGATR